MNGIERFQELAKVSDQDKDIRRGVLRNLVTAEILQVMEGSGITKSKLASELKCSKSHVSRLLSGDRNMTLDTLSDIALVLEMHFSVSLTKAANNGKRPASCIDFDTPQIEYRSAGLIAANGLYSISEDQEQYKMPQYIEA